MKLKEYSTYIEILIKNFNSVISSKDKNKADTLWDTAKFFLDKKNIPNELLEVVYLMDKYFTAYNKDPESNETLKLRSKLRLVA